LWPPDTPHPSRILTAAVVPGSVWKQG
jgi:hypothetical protein